MIIARLAVFGALILAGCDDRPKTWRAYVYPDVENMDRYVSMGGFDSFESCQAAAINVRNFTGGATKGDYVCGYRCGLKDGFGDIEICKEKRK